MNASAHFANASPVVAPLAFPAAFPPAPERHEGLWPDRAPEPWARVSRSSLFRGSLRVTGSSFPRDAVQVLQAIARRDREAFACAFDYYAPRLKSFMMKSGTSPDRAEELAQETMVTVWRKAALFDPQKASASAWIYTIARNLRIDGLRRDRRGDRLAVVLDEPPAEEPQPDAILAMTQTAEAMRDAVQALPPDQAEVIKLSFFEDMPHSDIATALGLPLGTVKSRVRLALQRLRTLLGDTL
jgi:RNA polymerase sigma-70 factor (ECF subfamily)